MTDRPYQMLPPLDPEQHDLLRKSIEANGVLEPVVFDEDGEILDGHHRVEIAEELDIDYPRRVVADLDEAGKRRYAITTNVARRQLVPAVRSALVAQLRTQGMSIRQIAESTGLPKTTVARDLDQVSQVGHLPDEVTGADNKTYAAKRPPKTPGSDGAEKVPPADSGNDQPSVVTVSDAPSAEGRTPGLPTAALTAPGSPVVAGNGGGVGVDPQLEADLAADSARRAAIRNLTSVLTFLNPLAITPAELAEREYAPVLDEFDQGDLDRAAETLTTLADLKRGH